MRARLKRLLNFFSSPVKAFVIIATIFGSFVVFLSPPLTGYDEEAHFVRAYGISTGDLRLYDSALVNVPTSFRQTIGCFQNKTNEPGTMYQYRYSTYGIGKKASLDCALALPLDEGNTERVSTSAQSYSPLGYIPQVLAVLIGRALDTPIVVMTYLVRLSTVAAYILLIALAIKILPVRKWALAGVALLPMSISALTNPGGDYILIGSVAIFVSIIIRSFYIPEQQLKKENTLLIPALLAAAVMMLQPKGIFPGICLLPLVIFYGGLGYKKAIKAAVIAASLTAGLLWQKFGINVELITLGNGTNSPLDFPSAFVKTMLTRWVDTDFIHVGDYVGNQPTPGNHLGMPSLIVTIINILFAIYLFVAYPEKLKPRIPKTQVKAFVYTSIVCALAIIAGSFAALFVGASFMQLPNEAIRGVNTRYFLPAYVALVVLPMTRKVFVKDEATMAKITIVGSLICLTAAIMILAIRFHWWNPLGIM